MEADGAAAWSDQLDQSHRQMLGWLVRLDELVSHLETEGWDGWARDQARGVIDFFSRTARDHHIEEERSVFPLLVGRGDAELDAAVEHLLQDHGWLEENWFELLCQLRPVAEGFSGYDIDMLRHATSVFDALLKDHITLEEAAVQPAARTQIAQQRQATEQRLARSMEAAWSDSALAPLS